MTALLLAAAILGIGTRLADGLRLRAEETILRKLDLPDAHAYYGLLAKRARKTRLLRAVTVVSLLLVVMAGRKRLFNARAAVEARSTAAVAPAAPAALSTEGARARAAAAASAHLPAGAGPARLETVSSDAAHPWIFDFVADAGASTERLRVYVDAAGQIEVHRRLPPGPADRGR